MFKLIKAIVSITILTLVFVAILAMCNGNKKNDSVVKTPNDWITVFSDNSFTEEEISSYKEILFNVGITDYHDVEMIENGRMHIVKGKIFGSNECDLHITLEERKIIVIYASLPYDATKPHTNWLCDIDLDSEKPNGTFDLYYDVDGGYTAKLDWENKTVRPYRQ